MAKVQHPNVVAATDSGRLEDGSLFLVLEYVRVETLSSRLERQRPLSSELASHIAMQVAAL